MRIATRRIGETAAIHCSSWFSYRLCRGSFNRSGDDSHKGISRYRPHLFLSLLARRYFFPYSLHRLTVTRRRRVPSESVRPRALSRTLPLANARICSTKQGRGGRRAVLPFSRCVHKHNISMYPLSEIQPSPPCFQGIISSCFIFSPLICKCARTPGIGQL
jgi:hypothetical protein